MGKGSNTVTTSPNPTVMKYYQDVFNRASTTSQRPYQPYKGQLVAPLSPLEQQAQQGITAASQMAQPYIQQAGRYAEQAATPITPTPWSAQAVQQYENPYQSDVINATMNQLNEVNAQQQQGVMGNAISSGAWGGDRSAVAQAELARQQGAAAGQTLAGLNQANYAQANQQFAQQQAVGMQAQQATNQDYANAAYTYGNLGVASQQAALQGLQSQAQLGAQGRAVQQAGDTARYQQFLNQQAYPFQSTQFLANIAEGIGGQAGGTTTYPSPSALSQIAGIALGGAGMLGGMGMLKRGGAVRRGYDTGGGIGLPYGYSSDPGTPTFNPTGAPYGTPAAQGIIGAGGAIPGVMNMQPQGHKGIAPPTMGSWDYYQRSAGQAGPTAPTAPSAPGGAMDSWANAPNYAALAKVGQNIMNPTGVPLGTTQSGVGPQVPVGDTGSDAAATLAAIGATDANTGVGGATRSVSTGRYPPAPDGGVAGDGNTISIPYGTSNIPPEAYQTPPMTKQDKWLTLAAMGAGMAASTSPFPGVAIGQGLQAGVNQIKTQRDAELRAEELWMQANGYTRAEVDPSGNSIVVTDPIHHTTRIVKLRDILAGKAGDGGGGNAPPTPGTSKATPGSADTPGATPDTTLPHARGGRVGFADGGAPGDDSSANDSSNYLIPPAPAIGFPGLTNSLFPIGGPAKPSAASAAAAPAPSGTGTVHPDFSEASAPVPKPSPEMAKGLGDAQFDANTKQWQHKPNLQPWVAPASPHESNPDIDGPADGLGWYFPGARNPSRNDVLTAADAAKAQQPLLDPKGIRTADAIDRGGKELQEYKNAAAAGNETDLTYAQMAQEINNMPDSAFLQPGGFGTYKLDFAKKWDAMQAMMGVPPEDRSFSQQDLATASTIVKGNLRTGFQSARVLGAKEAASVVQAAMAANPGLDQTKLTNQILLSSLHQGINYQRDRAAEAEIWAQRNGGSLDGFDNYFNQHHPLQNYSYAALAALVPPKQLQVFRNLLDDPSLSPADHAAYIASFSKKHGEGLGEWLAKNAQ